MLTQYGKVVETWDSYYTNFITVDEKYKPEGYLLRFPLYVQGPRHARIILSSDKTPDVDGEDAYEIRKEKETSSNVVCGI